MSEQSCPQCGAPIEKKSRGAFLIICTYCDSTLRVSDQDLSMVGKMAMLQEDGSPLQLGVRGRYHQRGFEVVGRIQLAYDRGYWNEWYLMFDDGEAAWLGEGQGLYQVTRPIKPHLEPPPIERLGVEGTVNIDGMSYVVLEIARIRIVSGAGELPFQIDPESEAKVVDMAGTGATFATLDYSEDPPLVFVGERVEFEDLSFSGLREFEGW